MHMFLCKNTSVTLDRWFWGQQGAGGGGCLKMAVGVEGVCKGCLHALAREKWGILGGGGGVNDR